jgi:protein phosphatase
MTLHAGRFAILGLRNQRDGLIRYDVTDHESDQHCQVCGSPLPNPKAIRCPMCDTVIQAPDSVHLIANEILDPDVFTVVKRLHSLRVDPPAMVLPTAVFSETVAEQTRYYYVTPDVDLRPYSETDPPQPLDRVMDWGTTLATGLATLHRHGIAFQEMSPEDILIGQEASWACCESLLLIHDETEEEIDRAYASDVRGLGRWMLLKATGHTSLGTDSSLPEPLFRLLNEVLMAPSPMSAQQLAEQLVEIRRQLVIRTDVRLCVGAQSDTGRMREINEDSLWVGDYQEAFDSLGIAVGGFAVADGVGGHAAGDIASQLTVSVLQQYGDEIRRAGEMAELPDLRGWMRKAVEAANHKVYEERIAVSNDMGSTLVMALFVGNEYTVLNVGDSRAYRLGTQGIQQITVDHTLVQRLVSMGQLTRDEAKMHPRRNVIYRVVGGQDDLDYDFFEGELALHEALLLCSDGLTDMLTDRVLWQIWRETPTPQRACDRMIDEANQVGGHDNITAILIQVVTGQDEDE